MTGKVIPLFKHKQKIQDLEIRLHRIYLRLGGEFYSGSEITLLGEADSVMKDACKFLRSGYRPISTYEKIHYESVKGLLERCEMLINNINSRL